MRLKLLLTVSVHLDRLSSELRNGPGGLPLSLEYRLNSTLHGGPVGDPLQNYADRFSGHYWVHANASFLGAFKLKVVVLAAERLQLGVRHRWIKHPYARERFRAWTRRHGQSFR